MFRRHRPATPRTERDCSYVIIVEEGHRFEGAIGARIGPWTERGVPMGDYLRLPGNLVIKVAFAGLRHVRAQDAPVHLLQNDCAATASKTAAYLKNETQAFRAAVRTARHRAYLAARAEVAANAAAFPV